MKKVTILDSKIVYDGHFQLEEATYKYEQLNGEMTEPVNRLCFHRSDAVAAIVYNVSTHKAILAKQFRYPAQKDHNGWLTEIVAGMIDNDEDPVTALKRELLEEIGYEPLTIEPLGAFYVSPAGSTEKIYLYYVEVNETGKIAAGGGLASESEDIELVEYSLFELRAAISNNEIPDAKSIIGCNYLLAKYPR